MSDIKITKERIDALLGEADIRTLTLFGKCTVVTAKLKNGFVLTADSACETQAAKWNAAMRANLRAGPKKRIKTCPPQTLALR